MNKEKKCPVCGKWKSFSDSYVNPWRGVCQGHPNPIIEPPGPYEAPQYEQALVEYPELKEGE